MLAVAVSAMCAAVPISEASAKRSFGARALERPMSGADVRTLQQLLTTWGIRLTADGQFGRQTKGAVRTWERANGRPVHGRLGRHGCYVDELLGRPHAAADTHGAAGKHLNTAACRHA